MSHLYTPASITHKGARLDTLFTTGALTMNKAPPSLRDPVSGERQPGSRAVTAWTVAARVHTSTVLPLCQALLPAPDGC